ncbi:MAG TPA: heme-binding protein [Candidatus Paceibacterota bacterium]|nr:heme-binding protein [Candidatus Paceibacterota bacterium]
MRSRTKHRILRLRYAAGAAGILLAVWLAASWLAVLRPARQYGVTGTGDGYELREYGELTAAQVRVTGSYPDALGHAVVLLDDYLDGENLKQPVEITTIRGRTTEASERVRGYGPVMWEEADGTTVVSVILPGRFTPDTAPRPKSPWVRIVSLPGRTVAAASFRGPVSTARVAEVAGELQRLLEDDKQLILSQFRVAGYAPPWVFPPLRRTEIHVTVR